MKNLVLRELIAHVGGGAISVGERIPTEMELAGRFGTSRMNARFAVEELRRLGIVSRNKKNGTVLVRKPEPHMLRELEGIASKRICVIASMGKSTMHHHWDASTLHGMERRFADLGYRMTRHDIPFKPSARDLETALVAAVDGGCSALILMPEEGEMALYRKQVETIYQYHNNVYVFNRIGADLGDLPFHVMEFDSFGEGALAARQLHACGIQKILTWWDPSVTDRGWAQRRIMGLKAGLCRLTEGACSPEILKTAHWKEVGAVADRIAAQNEHCGVVSLTDGRAALLLEAMGKQGLKAPDDFSLISFDADPRFASLNLTTISPPIDRLAELMVQFVAEPYSLKKGNLVQVKLGSRIVEGGTCRSGR